VFSLHFSILASNIITSIHNRKWNDTSLRKWTMNCMNYMNFNLFPFHDEKKYECKAHTGVAIEHRPRVRQVWRYQRDKTSYIPTEAINVFFTVFRCTIKLDFTTINNKTCLNRSSLELNLDHNWQLFAIYRLNQRQIYPVVCRRVHVLFTLFVFVCVQWSPTHIVLCFLSCLSSPFVIAPSVFSNVYLQFLWFVHLW
jgi:hypothetical protein